MALPAARLVCFCRANQYDGVVVSGRLPFNQALGAAGLFAANDADGV